MSFMLYFYHDINYLCRASDLDAFCNEGIVVQWMCMEDEGSHNNEMEIEWLHVGKKEVEIFFKVQ